MRLKSVHFQDFRRFTDLRIEGIPDTVRLIVLAGPNGVGKSSFFDGLQAWHQFNVWSAAVANESYNNKLGSSSKTRWYQRLDVKFHEPFLSKKDLENSAIYFQSAYRHEVEFSSRAAGDPKPPYGSKDRAIRAIDVDESVSNNYGRLMRQSVSAIYDDEIPDNTTKGEIRDRLSGKLSRALSNVFPDLTLTAVGNPHSKEPFEFTKGTTRGFPYINLSAGEKAAFDLLLDAVIKADLSSNAIWCIDEPELHIGTKVQGLLLKELMALLPPQSQLLLASHSLGFMSEAVKMANANPKEVAFLDFDSHDFDGEVTIEPITPTRDFWKRTLAVALDDVANLVAPHTLVLCEGGKNEFDAKCYRQIFSTEFPTTDFISVGNSHDVQTDRFGITGAVQAIAQGTIVMRIRDRDGASPKQIKEWRSEGTQVLSRRHIESYLFDPEVLEAFCDELGRPEEKEAIKNIFNEALQDSIERGKDPDDIKSASGSFFTNIKKHLGLRDVGTNTRAFAEEQLAPLIKPGMSVYEALRTDIFGSRD